MREAKGGCGRPLFFRLLYGLACALSLGCGSAQAQPDPEGASGWQPKALAHAQRQMVAAAHPLAVEAGLQILRSGGSAVDAAIATQLVLGLVEPQSSGLGGGAFLLHWDAAQARVRSYDGRESAPAAARPGRFLDALGRPLPYHEAVVSGLSVGVPGLLRMLELAHARHGRLAWAALFAPAIRLAEDGFPMSPRLHRLLSGDRHLREDPAARALYYDAAGGARTVGERIVNPAYAASLREIAAHGADAFYGGQIARDIVAAVRAHLRPGDLALADLAGYRARERAPVCGPFRAYRLCSMGPPSAGGIGVLQILGLLERSGFAMAMPDSAQDWERALHLYAEAGRLAYADRARWIADPDFVPQPVEGLLAPAYLDERAALIGERSMGWARPGTPRGAPLAWGPGGESEAAGTSHVSVVDARGDALAMTSTIESQFGSRIMVRGFLLNNQLTDFSFNPESEGLPAANRVEGGKRPRSSMAPTLVFGPEAVLAAGLRLTLGSPGGPAIINYVAKALVGTLAWGLDIQAAISLPNFGSANGPTLIERGSPWEEHGDALAARGHILSFRPLTSGTQGIETHAGALRGGADPRREGAARGD